MNNIEKLREEMRKKTFGGFIVPMCDEFGSEFVPANARRLEWLTGFSGSAGTAIVLAECAAFFTDGRYTLQASNEVSDCFEIYNIADKKPYEWLSEQAALQLKIGFDPWLHTENSMKFYNEIAKENEFSIAPVDVNFIDEIWVDRPLEKAEKTFIHDVKYAGKSHAEKIKDICKTMSENNADMLILTSPESICWLLNIRGNDLPCTPVALCYAMVAADKTVSLYIDEEKITDDVKKHLDCCGAIFPLEKFTKHLEKLKVKCVQIDTTFASLKIMISLKKSQTEIIKQQDPCILPKACKNKIEIEGAKKAHIIDGVAVCKFLFWLNESMSTSEKITEMSAEKKLEEFRRQSEFFIEPSFETISGFASNGAIVHYHAEKKSDKILEGNSLYLFDSGGQYPFGTTDVTRTIAIGNPTNEQKRNFTLVLKGHIAIAMAKFPVGTKASTLDILARYNLWQNGLDYDHGTGHGVGNFLGVHEGPQSIGKRYGNTELKSGMIISNEPGYYKTGEYGIRIESLLLVKKCEENNNFLRFETLTMIPIDSSMIDKKMLSDSEIKWLGSYHNNVLKNISPYINKKTITWLERQSL